MSVTVTLQPITSLANNTTAIAQLNNNFTLIANTLSNALALNGQTPNQMQTNFDINGFRLLNLPTPINSTDPVRLQDTQLPGVPVNQASLALTGTLGVLGLSSLAGVVATGTVTTTGVILNTSGNSLTQLYSSGNYVFLQSNDGVPVTAVQIGNSVDPTTYMFIRNSGAGVVFRNTANNNIGQFTTGLGSGLSLWDTTAGFTTVIKPAVGASNNTLTLPGGGITDTLVARNTTDTLLNKTLSNPVISAISNAGTVTLPNVTCTLLSTGGNTLSVSGGIPAGTASTTQVMMGLGSTFTITPKFSTRVAIWASGYASNATVNDGGAMTLRYGTGSAPANGAAASGTTLSVSNFTSAVAAGNLPFSLIGIAFGLTTGTAYWIDISLAAVTGGTASLGSPYCVAFEV